MGMINNLQMREVPNGCITIDAQPCGLVILGGSHIGLQTYATNQVISPEPFSYALDEVKDEQGI